MDPITAMGVAGNVVQFVDFAFTLISKSRKIYKSDSGMLDDHLSVKTIADDLSSISFRLGHSLRALPGNNGQLSDAELALDKISKCCAEEAQKLLSALKHLERNGKHDHWKSFKIALKTMWRPDEIDDLLKRLDDFRKALDTRILVTLRADINLAKMQQSEEFKRLNGNIQCVVELLLNNQKAFMDTLQAQMATFKQMQTRTNYLLIHGDQREKPSAETEGEMEAPTTQTEGEMEAPTTQTEGEMEAPSARALQASILKTLTFQTMADRHQDIHEAHEATFDWIYHDPENEADPFVNFISWLQSGKGIYWVNGKAGSGKSTLLKYLYGDQRTKTALKKWSPEVITASFFFWRAGNDFFQQSQIGLLRSVLHEILSRQPRLLPLVLPQQWYAWDPSHPSYAWTLPQLKDAFKVVVGEIFPPAKLCLFIDGLDEFTGDHREIVDLFKESACSENAKFCLSSRPLNVFEQAFEHCPGLELQYLTSRDISNYVTKCLGDHSRMKEMQSTEPQLALCLVEEIVKKAAGVFLWVELVVKSLLESLTNWDTFADLERRLKQFPPELDALYMHMLQGVESFYKPQASEIFQTVRRVKDPIETLLLSFALEDPGFVIDAPVQILNSEEKLKRCKEVDKWLKSRCLGLLEVRVRRHYSILRGTSASNNEQLITSKVEYLHRTVSDFLEQPEVWRTVCADAKPSFNVNVALLAAYLMKLKTTASFGHLIGSYGRLLSLVSQCLEYAVSAQANSTTPQHFLLLDDLNRVAAVHWRQMATDATNKPLFWRDNNVSWKTPWVAQTTIDPSCGITDNIPARSFLELAEERDLLWYVREKRERHYEEVNKAAGRTIVKYNGKSLITSIISTELGRREPDGCTPWMRLLHYMEKTLPLAAGLDSQNPDQELLWLWMTTFHSLLRKGADRKHNGVQNVREIFRPWFPEEISGFGFTTAKNGGIRSLIKTAAKLVWGT